VEVRGKRTYITIVREPRVIYNKSSLDQLEIDSYGCEYIYHDINRNKTIQVFDEDNLHTLGIFLFEEIDGHYAGSIPGLAPLNL
jgi:hypothetical protein